MLSSLNYTSVNLNSIDFSVGETPPVNWLPVEYFDCSDIPLRGEARPKMERHGTWPRRQFMDEMPIEIHGALLGDGVDDFVSKRLAFRSTILPDPTIDPDVYMGTVTITLEGNANVYTTQVGLQSFTMVTDATQNGPDYAHFQIIWVSFTPWFLDVGLDPIII